MTAKAIDFIFAVGVMSVGFAVIALIFAAIVDFGSWLAFGRDKKD